MVAPFFFSDGRISDTVSWMFYPRLYKTHPPTGRCSAGLAPRKCLFPAFSGTYPHLLCLLYYSGICRHFQVTMKFISGCFYTRLWPQSTFLLSAPGAATMTFSGVVSRNTSPTTSLPSAVTSWNATGTTLSAPLAQVASVCPVCQEALSDEESAEAPPAAEEARRFRGSVPTAGRGSGWEPADTTVSAEEHAKKSPPKWVVIYVITHRFCCSHSRPPQGRGSVRGKPLRVSPLAFNHPPAGDHFCAAKVPLQKRRDTHSCVSSFLERATRLELASRHPTNGCRHSQEPCLTS